MTPHLARLLGEMDLTVRLRWSDSVVSDEVLATADVYTERHNRGPSEIAQGRIAGHVVRQVEIPTTGNRGHLVDAFMDIARSTLQKALEGFILDGVMRKIDRALFAMEHADGHGIEVAHGLREMWILSGTRTWSEYDARRSEILLWMEALAEADKRAEEGASLARDTRRALQPEGGSDHDP